MGLRGPIGRPPAVPPGVRSPRSHRRREYLTVLPAEPPRSAPKPPPGLLPATRRLWVALWTSDVARTWRPDSQLHVLVRYIRALDAHARLAPAELGTVREQRLIATLHWVESRFGLSPMSELRMGLMGVRGALTAAQLNAMADDEALDLDDALLDEFEPDAPA